MKNTLVEFFIEEAIEVIGCTWYKRGLPGYYYTGLRTNFVDRNVLTILLVICGAKYLSGFYYRPNLLKASVPVNW